MLDLEVVGSSKPYSGEDKAEDDLDLDRETVSDIVSDGGLTENEEQKEELNGMDL